MPMQPNKVVTQVLRGLGGLLSPAGRRARLTILIYHRVLAERDPLFPEIEDAVRFTWQMETVSRFFNVLPLSEAIMRLRKNSLPSRALCVTFDDGYADNYHVALPILQKFNLPATFFIAMGYLDGGRMWNDTVIETFRNALTPVIDLSEIGLERYEIGDAAQRRVVIQKVINRFKYLPFWERQRKANELAELIRVPLPDDLMMTREELRKLFQAGMEIGGHTLQHPILARLRPKEAREEIEEGKRQTEEVIGQRVDLFAYPNGKPKRDYTIDHVKMVREAGFSGAVSTAWGVSTSDADVYQLARFTPWDASPQGFVLRLFKNYWHSSDRVE